VRLASSGRSLSLSFVLHPFPDKVGTGVNSEIAILSVNEEEDRCPVQFFQMGKTQNRPQLTVDR